MDESEFFILTVSLTAAFMGMGIHAASSLHPLYFRGNPAPGIVRVGILLAMGWILYVLLVHADPSVTWLYVIFYLVMGYAVVKMFGQTMVGALGFRFRVDVIERRNVPAAILVAAFILSTGLIFGGSLWGDADPVGDDEGGWWIPLGFFLLGWGVLMAAFGIFLRREGGRFARRVRRDRNVDDARRGALFLLAAAVTLTDAVAGDFWGWRHGLTTFGVLAGLVVAHELFRSSADGGAGAGGVVARGREVGEGSAGGASSPRGRRWEGPVYLLLGLGAWALNRFLDLILRNG